MHQSRTVRTGMVAAAVSLVLLIASNALAADPPECSEMAEVFTTLRHWNNESSEFYSCVSRAYSAVDGVTFFYSVTSKKGANVPEKYHFGVSHISGEKCSKRGYILRLLDKFAIFLKKKAGSDTPDFFIKAALDERPGEYFVNGRRVAIVNDNLATDLSITFWK